MWQPIISLNIAEARVLSAALYGEVGILKFPAQFIVVCQSVRVLFQSQAEENAGVRAKRHGRVPAVDRLQRRASDTGALGNLRGAEFSPQPG